VTYEMNKIILAAKIILFHFRHGSVQPLNSLKNYFNMEPRLNTNTHTHNLFTALFPGLPQWACAGRNLL